jgi:energy-coupling factor transport system permease protein
MTITGFRFVEGESYLHRRHPLAKLLALLALIVALLLFESPAVPAVCALILLAAYMSSGLGMRRYLQVARRFILFAVLIVLAHLLLLRQSGPASELLLSGLERALEIFDLLVLVDLFAAVTDPVDLTDSILWGLRPLERVGAPVHELSLTLMIVFSFLPLMGHEVERLSLAQGTRCGFGGSLVSRVRGTVPLLGALFVGVMRRAEELELSLSARHYRLGGVNRSAGHARLAAADYIFCAAALALFTAGVYAKL